VSASAALHRRSWGSWPPTDPIRHLVSAHPSS